MPCEGWPSSDPTDQGADLGKAYGLSRYTGQDSVLASDRGSAPAVQTGYSPRRSRVWATDPPVTAGAPLDDPAEAVVVLEALRSEEVLACCGMRQPADPTRAGRGRPKATVGP